MTIEEQPTDVDPLWCAVPVAHLYPSTLTPALRYSALPGLGLFKLIN
jgi:hypothetical protein